MWLRVTRRPDARAIHEALVKANPDQVIRGTDWPHPRLEKDMPEDGHLLDLFNAWTPDAGLRKKSSSTIQPGSTVSINSIPS